MNPITMPTSLLGQLGNPLADPLASSSSVSNTQSNDSRELTEVAKKFEAVFVHKLLGSMRETISDGGLFGDGISKQMKDMYWMFMGDEMAKSGSLGLWKQLASQLGDDATAEPASTPKMEILK